MLESAAPESVGGQRHDVLLHFAGQHLEKHSVLLHFAQHMAGPISIPIGSYRVSAAFSIVSHRIVRP